MTGEFHGLFKNGGIGTANTGLALALGRAGYDVVVAFVDSDAANHKAETEDLSALKRHYLERGVTLEMVPRHPLLASGVDGHLAASYSVYAYLQPRAFDVVFFNECGGQGYYSLLAKHTGLFRDPPRMCVVAHGSLAWVLEINGQLNWGLRPIAMNYVERRSAELADALIAPSRYLIEWMASRRWALPGRVRMIQNIVPTRASETPPAATSSAVTELVFFGRLEARKGLELFCDAIDRLAKTRDLSRLGVTFMGKFSKIGGLHSGVYIMERSRGWKAELKIIVHFDQNQALDYLRRPGALAVIPSLAENSPCVVAECLLLGIPFIATDSGGTSELVAEEDRTLCLVEPNASALCAKLGVALDTGLRPGRMAVPQADTCAQWLDFLASWLDSSAEPIANSPGKPEPSGLPRVSICLVRDCGEPEASPRLLNSILAQTYAEFEVVIVAYGGETAESSDDPGRPAWSSPVARWFRDPTPDRGEARNAAAKHATGDYLLFLDERRVLLRPTCIEAFVGVASRCGVDVVTGVPLEFEQAGAPNEGWDGQLGYFPLGSDKELAAFENCLGHSVMLIDRERFEAIGGFESGVSPAIEDWLLLARALIAGCALEIAPAPLYWLRASRSRPFAVQERVEEQRRILHAYRDEKIGTVGRALESVIVWSPQTRDFVMNALAGVGGVAKDIATELSFTYTPTDPDSYKAFVEYCIARGRFREASAFAGLANPGKLLPLVRNAAEATATKAATAAISDLRRDYLHPVDLTSLVAERIRPVSARRASLFTNAPGVIIAYSQPPGMTIMKAPAACPPGTRSAEVAVAVDGADGSTVEFALVVSEPHAQINFSDHRNVTGEGAWWSGWARAGEHGAATSVRASLDRPVDGPLDIFLLSRIDGKTSMGPRVTWRSARAEVSVFELATPSDITLETASSSLPRRLIGRAELLTPAPDFPVPFFTPGDPIMHHPLAGRAALVRIQKALFPGASGVRAVASVQNERAHPIEFALWARRPSEPARDEASLAKSLGSSGWTRVSVPFQQHAVTLDLDAPAGESLDLYLATRVSEFSDVNWCHAAWHEISVTERLVPAR